MLHDMLSISRMNFPAQCKRRHWHAIRRCNSNEADLHLWFFLRLSYSGKDACSFLQDGSWTRISCAHPASGRPREARAGGGGSRWQATGRVSGGWRESLQRRTASPLRLQAQRSGLWWPGPEGNFPMLCWSGVRHDAGQRINHAGGGRDLILREALIRAIEA